MLGTTPGLAISKLSQVLLMDLRVGLPSHRPKLVAGEEAQFPDKSAGIQPPFASYSLLGVNGGPLGPQLNENRGQPNDGAGDDEQN